MLEQAPRSVAVWRDGLRQLAVQARSTECDVRRDLQNHAQRSWSQELAAELRGAWTDLQGEREVWEKELWTGLAQLRQRVTVLGANMRFASRTEELRKMIVAVEHKLQVYAEQSRQQHEELASEERNLQQSLEASLARFEAWTQTSAAPRPAPRRAASAARRPPEGAVKLRQRLKELTAQLGAGRGGWSSEDHEAFARLLLGRFRGKASPGFLEEAQLLLPFKSHEALVAHGKLLLEQEELQMERRTLLAAWREHQEAEKPHSEPVQEAIQERRARSAAQRRARESRAAQRQCVEDWRKAQEAAKTAEAARMEAERRREDEAERARQQKREAQKQELRAFRQRREEQRVLEQAAKEVPAERSRPLSPTERRRLADRTSAMLRHREQLMKETQKRYSFEPPARAMSYPHVESRLWSHTEDFVDRARSLQETQDMERKSSSSKYGVVPGNFAHQGLVRTVRAVPSWRLSVAGA
mmetsp:Transcript_72958/g.170968  ORF Transcript_72958/g.170968 Transcript_72958/m.170968 type:complete len:471 (-) Transcript_72958:23-1435(-)